MFKMLKSKIALILAVIVAVCSASSVFSVSADEVDPSLSVNSAEITAGDTGEISIDIKVKNFSKVVGLQLYINYGELELLSATSNCINLSETNYSYNNSTGNFSLAKVGDHTQGNDYISGFTATDDETTLLTITFAKPSSATAGTEYTVEILEESLFCDDDENLVTVITSSGKITVKKTYIIGDVDMDGEITANDRRILARYLAEWDGYEEQIVSKEAADIDKDGEISPNDRRILARYLAEWDGYDEYFK